MLENSNGTYHQWFEGGILNTCYNCLDRHIERGNGDQTALIYDSPVTSTIRRFSYRELRDLVATCAGGLAERGVKKGDRVVIYMPMIPETVIAMLACARIGAIHSVVFGGFAARELAARIRDAQPKMVISASCGIEIRRIIPYKPLLDEAIILAGIGPIPCVICQRPEARATLIEGQGYFMGPADATLTWSLMFPAKRPIPSISSIHPEPPGSRRGWSGITAGILSHCNGA